VICSACNNRYNDYGTNDKKVGENAIRYLSSSIGIGSLDDLMQFADLIVEGEVISDGELVYDPPPQVEGASRGDFPDLDLTDGVATTHTKFKVTNTYYGETSSEIITILQFGLPDTDFGEIKIQKGQKLICMLRNSSYKNIYASVSWENGFYDISDEKVMAFSNINGLSKFDEKSVDELRQEFKNVIKRSK